MSDKQQLGPADERFVHLFKRLLEEPATREDLIRALRQRATVALGPHDDAPPDADEEISYESNLEIPFDGFALRASFPLNAEGLRFPKITNQTPGKYMCLRETADGSFLDIEVGIGSFDGSADSIPRGIELNATLRGYDAKEKEKIVNVKLTLEPKFSPATMIAGIYDPVTMPVEPIGRLDIVKAIENAKSAVGHEMEGGRLTPNQIDAMKQAIDEHILRSIGIAIWKRYDKTYISVGGEYGLTPPRFGYEALYARVSRLMDILNRLKAESDEEYYIPPIDVRLDLEKHEVAQCGGAHVQIRRLDSDPSALYVLWCTETGMRNKKTGKVTEKPQIIVW